MYKRQILDDIEFLKNRQKELMEKTSLNENAKRTSSNKDHLDSKKRRTRRYMKQKIKDKQNDYAKNGHPIVNTPSEAIEVFIKSDLDGLILNNFIITRKIEH